MKIAALRVGFIGLFFLLLLSPFHTPSWLPPIEIYLQSIPQEEIVNRSTITLGNTDGSVTEFNDVNTFSPFSPFGIANILLTFVPATCVICFLAGIGFLLFQTWRLFWISFQSKPVLETRVKKELQTLFEDLNIDRPVRLQCSRSIPVAITTGVSTTTIILNTNYRTWSQNHLRAVLAHELFHIKKQDFFFNLLSTFCAFLYLANPFVLYLRKKLTHLQENKADRKAADLFRDTLTYPCALAELSLQNDKGVKHFIAPAFIVRDLPFVDRIKEINQKGITRPPKFLILLTCTIMFAISVGISGLRIPGHIMLTKDNNGPVIQSIYLDQ